MEVNYTCDDLCLLLGIIIYPVACEPALSHYKNARAFMVGLAEITEGYATSLANSALLAGYFVTLIIN